MPKKYLNQAGVIHILAILTFIILAAGLVAGLYLVQKTQIFKPKAAEIKTSITGQEAKLDPVIKSLTDELLGLDRQNDQSQAAPYLKEDQASIQAKLDKMVEIAKKRKGLLLQKLKDEKPQDFLVNANLADEREKFPEQTKEYIEKRIDTEGYLSVVHVDYFEEKKSEFDYFLKQKDDKLPDTVTYELYFADKPPVVLSGFKVKVKGGIGIDDQLVMANAENVGNNTLQVIAAEAQLSSLGDQKTLVLLVNFEHNRNDKPYTVDYINNIVLSSVIGSVNHFYKENSFNKASLSGRVVGWYTIKYNSCSWSDWGIQAQSQAQSQGIDVNSYNRFVYIFPPNSQGCFSAGGMGTIGGAEYSESWIFSLSQYVIAHELGHNFGTHHANLLSCLTQGDYTNNCTNFEYGDSTDVMGNGYLQFNAPHKVGVGWMGSNNITSVLQDGTFTLAPLEMPSSQTQVLMIPKTDRNEQYYVSYRQALGHYDRSLDLKYTDGVSIHIWNNDPFSQTKFVNNIGIKNTAVLSDGDTFYDSINKIWIKQISHNPSGVTVEVGFGSIPTFQPIPPGAYQRVFITNASYNGSLGGLSGADKKCQDSANAANLGGTWKAWLSDRATSASSRVTHGSNPYKLLDGKVIANNWDDLTDGSIQYPIDITERRQTAQQYVWTNTKADGQIKSTTNDCYQWTSSNSMLQELGVNGYSGYKEASWTESGAIVCPAVIVKLYCFEEPVSVVKTPPCEIYGDLNLDGQVTDADREIVEKIVGGQIIPSNSASGDTQYMNTVGDVNGDQNITSEDTLRIRKYVDGSELTFPVCINAKLPPSNCNNLGDVTTDGKITLMDAYEALRMNLAYTDSIYTKQPYTAEQKRRADVDLEKNSLGESVSSVDSLRILRYINGTDTTFKACSSITASPIPSASLIPAQGAGITTHYRMSDDLNVLNNLPWKEYTKDSMVVDYEFSDKTPGTKFIWVEFKDSTGKIERKNIQINLESSTSVSSPSSPPPTISPSIQPSSSPIGNVTGSTYTAFYKVASDPNALSSTPKIPYTYPLTLDYEFPDKTPGTKFIWVEFEDNNGKTERRNIQVELLPQPAQQPTQTQQQPAPVIQNTENTQENAGSDAF